MQFAGAGVWGALATWEESNGTRWILVPFWGPKHSAFTAPIEHGQVVQGAVAAFKMEEKGGKLQLTPAWLSRNMWQADPVVIANGVVFAYGNGEDATQATFDGGLSYNTSANRIAHSGHATLYALDALTGAELWSSGDQITSFSHFSSLAVANGRVYLGTYDGTLYCFGVKPTADEVAMRRQWLQRRLRAGSWRRIRGMLVSASVGFLHAQGRGGGEWTTSGFDAQRSGWLRGDARLTKDAVQKGEFAFLWSMKIENASRQLNSLTPPVLLDRLIGYRGFKSLAFFGGSDDRVFSVDTDLARPSWTTVLNYSAPTGGQPPSSMDMSGRPDRDAEPAHRARAGRARSVAAADAAAFEMAAPWANRAEARRS